MSVVETTQVCTSAETNAVARRAPQEVMRLARMGSFHASRLSFMRVVLRELMQNKWQITRAGWQLDEKGIGHAVYTARLGAGEKQAWSLVVFSHDLPDEKTV